MPLDDPVTGGPKTPIWTDPPLPGGTKPLTPGGDGTIRSGGGLTASALVGPACRIPILYGRCLISPDVVAVSMSNYRAEFEVVISEGPIDAVEDWLTDTAATFESLAVTLGTLSTPVFGLEGTVGLAAARIHTKAGRPYQPRCIARGRKLFDPRLGAWGAGEYPDPAHTAYSTNPALVMADLLLFPQYGWGLPNVTAALIDWTSVEDAADWCDEVVDSEKRYELNLWLQQGQAAAAWSEAIGLHAGLRWTEAEGFWRLDYAAPVATVAATITDDHVVAGSTPRLSYGSGAGLADRPNVFTAEWIDPASDWQVRTVEIRHPSVDAGEPRRLAAVYQFHGFHSEAMCLRALWRVACDIWSEQELEAELTPDMLHLVDGSRVTASLACLGLSGVDFLVTRSSYDAGRVAITARRYDADTWSPPSSSSDVLPGSGIFDTPPCLTSLSIVAAETEITASSPTSRTTVKRLGAEWNLPVFAWGRRVVVRYWNAYTLTPAWDDVGFEEFLLPLNGTPGLGSDPDWIGSLSPHDYETTVDNFDALGQNTFSSITAPGLTLGARLESAAGLLSTPIFASRLLATSTSTSTFPTVAASQVAGETRSDGEVAVWDAANAALRYDPVATVVPDASTTVKGKAKLATSSDTAAGLVVQASDTRLSDARTPTAHSQAATTLTLSATDKLVGRSSAGSGAAEEIACTAAGRALLDDANAAAQRATLGLGTAATANTGAGNGLDADMVDGLHVAESASAAAAVVSRSSEGAVAALSYNNPVGAPTIGNGLNSNISGARGWTILGGPTGAFSVGGFVAMADGTVLNILNVSGQAMTIVNEDASSTAANRIQTLTGANVTGKTAFTLIYLGATARWYLFGRD